MKDIFSGIPATVKIYETDGMVLDFEAKVISCRQMEDGFGVVLDRTAFFPGGGGQECDEGQINSVRVTRTVEKDGVIVHVTREPVEEGITVPCSVDKKERMRRMEHHTGEHIFSGTLHKYFGLENVGFHLGSEYVTIDTSGPMTADRIAEAERLANEAVRRNDRIEILFPDSKELEKLEYRSKKELSGRIRIVKIGETDTCACCAPHLLYTGQVGMIAIISAMPYKGGMRLAMLAGDEAVKELRRRQNSLKACGEMLSVKPNEVPEALGKLKESLEDVSRERISLIYEMCESKLFSQSGRRDFRLLVCEKADARIANRLGETYCKDVLFFLAVFGCEGSLKYVMKSEKTDLKSAAPLVNEILKGRGGGKSGEISGSASVTLREIEGAAETIYEKLKG